MFVAASVFQFDLILLEVFTTPVTCTLLGVTLAAPAPFVPIIVLFVTSPLILLNASLRSVCNVNELVVIEPTKKREPSVIESPAIFGSALLVLPSVSVLNLTASPVVSPWLRTSTLSSVMLI